MKLLKKLFPKQKKFVSHCDDIHMKDEEIETFRPPMDVLISYLQDIYREKIYAEYIGGTLIFKIFTNGVLGGENMIFCNFTDDDMIFCNFTDDDATPEYLFWLAILYLKYKNLKNSHYNKAENIVRSYEDKALAAKLLLEISNV